jgi:hypothetical protein
MSTSRTPKNPSEQAELRLRRYNRRKTVRTALQIAVLVLAVAFGVLSLVRGKPSAPVSVTNTATGADAGNQLIAISYPGLTSSTSLDSKVVNVELFKEQITALQAAGYVTVSQKDVADYYLRYGALPQKALFLLFEDGLYSTTTLAQPVLTDNAYVATVCTYANNLGDASNSKYITTPTLKSLIGSGTWELGTNGYRLAYINVFDRYNNFFGALNAEEFVKIHSYLWRDYNHYLMDFVRDGDRLRTETEAQLRARIDADYDAMKNTYTDAVGYLPGCYVLMHSNTGAFGTDPVASEANRSNLTRLFTLNFNREGTCLNNRDSSIFDLSRLQVQSYFSTNHLLMRIRDDTGDETLPFVTGDEAEAAHWYADGGAAQYKGNEIIVTTVPAGRGQLTLNTRLFSDLDMTVTLQGNLVGRQSICLRTDRNWAHGIEVALEDNHLQVWTLGDERQMLFDQNLYEFDGGTYISTQEDEHNGLVELQKAIIQLDQDPARVAQAQTKLAQLLNTPVVTLEDGGTPYYPVNDTTERGNRKLRIRLVGDRLSLWVDDRPAADQLKVTDTQLGSISLGAKVFDDAENQFTQRNIYDDVYDARFLDMVICDAQNPDIVLYQYTNTPAQTVNSTLTGWFNSVIQFFVDHF